MLIKKVGKKAFVNLFAILLLLALLAAIYLQAYMGTFSRYLADDYCTAGLLKQYGYWGSISNRFFTWDGRYSFSILIFLFDIFGNKFTSVLPSIAITLLLGGTFFLFAQISKRIFTKSNYLLLFLLSSIFVFTLIYTVPQVVDDIYWMTGIATYLFSIIFELFLLGSVVKILPEMSKFSKSKQILYLIIFFIFTFFCSGFSEVSTALHVAIFGLLLILAIIQKVLDKTANIIVYSMILFLGALLGFALMASAPGNSVRSASMSLWSIHPSIIKLFPKSILKSSMFITKWFFSHTTLIWASFIIIAFIGAYYSASRDLVPEFTPRKRVVSFLYFLGSMIGLVFVSYVPTTWMGYSVPEDRILIMTVSILCGFLVYISFFAGFAFREGFKFANNNSLAPIIILNFLLLFFAITIPLNYKNQYYSDFGPIQEKYASDWDRANAEIQTEINSGKKDIVVQNVAYNITENERISEDKASWVNQCAAEYYQVDSIVSR